MLLSVLLSMCAGTTENQLKMTAPEFHPDLLFQSVVFNPEGERNGYRINTEGHYYAKTGEDSVWTEQMILSEAQLQAMMDLLNGTQEKQWRGSTGNLRDDPAQTVTWVQFLRKGEQVNLCLLSGNEQPAYVTELLKQLTALFIEK